LCGHRATDLQSHMQYPPHQCCVDFTLTLLICSLTYTVHQCYRSLQSLLSVCTQLVFQHTAWTSHVVHSAVHVSSNVCLHSANAYQHCSVVYSWYSGWSCVLLCWAISIAVLSTLYSWYSGEYCVLVVLGYQHCSVVYTLQLVLLVALCPCCAGQSALQCCLQLSAWDVTAISTVSLGCYC